MADLLYSGLIDATAVMLSLWTGMLLTAAIIVFSFPRKSAYLATHRELQPIAAPATRNPRREPVALREKPEAFSQSPVTRHL